MHQTHTPKDQQNKRPNRLQIKLVEQHSTNNQDKELQNNVSHQRYYRHILWLKPERNLTLFLHLPLFLPKGVNDCNRCDRLPSNTAPETGDHKYWLVAGHTADVIFWVFRERLGLDVVDESYVWNGIQEGSHARETDGFSHCGFSVFFQPVD